MTPKKRRKKRIAFDEKRRERFLALLSQGDTVAFACARVGISRETAYNHRERDPLLAAAWAEAEEAGTQAMEQEAYRRAVHGVDEPVFWKGEPVGTVRRYSDFLLIFLLKSRRPEVYRDRAEVAVRRPPVDPSQMADEDLDTIHRVIAKYSGAFRADKPPRH